jgi:cell division protein ZapA
VDGAETGVTEVEIFGAVYHVRGRDDSGYLQELATLVDGKMREVAERVRTVDTAKIAILAALNIADELQQCRQRHEGERDEIRERVTALAGELAAALGS